MAQEAMVKEMTTAEVRSLLEMQGFAVLEDDLPEITARFNALVLGLSTLADQIETEVEAWPTPVPRYEKSEADR